jgi:hypothetical protein
MLMINQYISAKDKHAKVIFRNDIRSLLKKINCKIYDKYDYYYFTSRKFPIVGTTQVNNLRQIKNMLLDHNLKVSDIDTLSYNGIYFEASPELIGLFIAPKKEYVSLSQDVLNLERETAMVQELKAFGAENNLANLNLDLYSAVPLWMGDESVVSEISGMSGKQVFFQKLLNSHKEYISNYLNYRDNGSVFQFSETHNSIQMFSWIYYWEIKIMAEIFKGANISIHDVGTCNALFPLLLSGLSEQDLLGLHVTRIIASDINIESVPGNDIKKIIKQNKGYKAIQFMKLDLTKSLRKISSTDVITLNDVLEHFENDEISFSVLKQLWNKTGKLLIVHVPFESTPDHSWDHRITFHADKIRDWAQRLPGACFLSDNFWVNDKTSLTDQGFLVVAK